MSCNRRIDRILVAIDTWWSLGGLGDGDHLSVDALIVLLTSFTGDLEALLAGQASKSLTDCIGRSVRTGIEGLF